MDGRCCLNTKFRCEFLFSIRISRKIYKNKRNVTKINNISLYFTYIYQSIPRIGYEFLVFTSKKRVSRYFHFDSFFLSRIYLLKFSVVRRLVHSPKVVSKMICSAIHKCERCVKNKRMPTKSH